jgi:hypothetical protein
MHVLMLNILLDKFPVNQIVLDTHKIQMHDEFPTTFETTANILIYLMFLHLE